MGYFIDGVAIKQAWVSHADEEGYQDTHRLVLLDENDDVTSMSFEETVAFCSFIDTLNEMGVPIFRVERDEHYTGNDGGES